MFNILSFTKLFIIIINFSFYTPGITCYENNYFKDTLISSKEENTTFRELPLKFEKLQPRSDAIVQAFEYSFEEVRELCDEIDKNDYKYGYIQVYPITTALDNYDNDNNDWWTRYQPIDYNVLSRSGENYEIFEDMVIHCRSLGIGIIVDVVFNHVSSSFLDRGPFDPSNWNEYFHDNHNCPDDKDMNWNSPRQVHDCKLLGMPDIKIENIHSAPYKIQTGFLGYLLDIGVSGIRFDAAKHMDQHQMYLLTNYIKTEKESRDYVFDFLIYQEVIDNGDNVSGLKDSDYSRFGKVTSFKFSKELADNMGRNYDNNFKLKHFSTINYALDSRDAIVFVDNHDTERHGDKGRLSYKEWDKYTLANVFAIVWPYGQIKIMSSYKFDNFDEGSDGKQRVNQYKWHQIVNALKLRKLVEGTGMTNIWKETEQDWKDCFYFNRGSIESPEKGVAFIYINNTPRSWDDNYCNQWVYTGLPEGSYKNGWVYHEELINVDKNGYVKINVAPDTAVFIMYNKEGITF
jgi:alpha-amylase